MSVWSSDEIVQAAAWAIATEEGRRTIEQSPYGMESLDEVALHPLLAEAMTRMGAGVLREQPYPGEWTTKRRRRRGVEIAGALPDDSQRKRCDLVLTPAPGQRLDDGLRRARRASEDETARRGTLFEAAAPLSGTEPPEAIEVAAEDAYWLEVKLVGQFTYTCGVPGPNGTYASQLVRGVGADVRKLRDDPRIVRSGVLLLLLTATAEVATADVGTLLHRLLDRGLLVRSPTMERVALPDRIGNGVCTVVLIEPMAM